MKIGTTRVWLPLKSVANRRYKFTNKGKVAVTVAAHLLNGPSVTTDIELKLPDDLGYNEGTCFEAYCAGPGETDLSFELVD